MPLNLNLERLDEGDGVEATLRIHVALKTDCDLFSRLYISCQTRDGNLDQFFSLENQAAPPALSTGGKLRLEVQADLLHCLEKDLPGETGVSVVDAAILDGAAVVQMLNPGISKTFQEYADAVFVPYICSSGENQPCRHSLGHLPT